MKKILLLTQLLAISLTLFSQATTSPKTTKNIQPKIMVIPRVPEGIDMKAFYDSSMNLQIAISKVNESFLKRGANLISFDQVRKQMQQNEMLNKAAGNSSDYKAKVLQNSSSDIYVEAKIDVVSHSGNGAKSVNLILDAYQTGTGNVMSSKTVAGPMFRTDDVGQLTMLAIDQVSEEFLNLMQLKFDDIVQNGQSIFVQFTVADGANNNMDSEIQGTMLSELLDTWMSQNAVNGVFNNQGATTTEVIFSDVRIPLKNPKNPNSNYTGQNFYSDINKYLKSIGVNCKREIGTNNKIIVTIL